METHGARAQRHIGLQAEGFSRRVWPRGQCFHAGLVGSVGCTHACPVLNDSLNLNLKQKVTNPSPASWVNRKINHPPPPSLFAGHGKQYVTPLPIRTVGRWLTEYGFLLFSFPSKHGQRPSKSVEEGYVHTYCRRGGIPVSTPPLWLDTREALDASDFEMTLWMLQFLICFGEGRQARPAQKLPHSI